MSQQRRERQQQREGEESASSIITLRTAIYAVLIVAAFALAYYLGHRYSHRYDTFAKCLTAHGVKMYGAYWCPHCAEQKEKFGSSFEFVPYVECGVPGNSNQATQECKDAGIKKFPTWQFPPTGERVERVFPLEELSDRTGCALP
jgi:hypothetical protein